ncbi:MAG: pentapeptide repeat-containing protein, partial [Dolichospermum sp.]
MANPEHLAILKQGVGVWNNWKLENPNITPDFREHDFWGRDLSRFNLRDADLCGSNLCGCNLREADLRNTKLYRADLCGADLYMADLRNADIREANLFMADLRKCDFTEANLSGAFLINSRILDAHLRFANITGAYIKDWLINSETNLDGVICEYVYLDAKKTERRPINGNFAPGEFASLYEKIIENTDLILCKTPQNDNINNQGVQFYSNSTIHTWENLRFRSKAEIKIAEALDITGVLFVPNCLTRLTTPKGRENKEADFLICYNGK